MYFGLCPLWWKQRLAIVLNYPHEDQICDSRKTVQHDEANPEENQRQEGRGQRPKQEPACRHLFGVHAGLGGNGALPDLRSPGSGPTDAFSHGAVSWGGVPLEGWVRALALSRWSSAGVPAFPFRLAAVASGWRLTVGTKEVTQRLMNSSLSRREFLSRSAALGAFALTSGLSVRAADFKGRLRHAMIVGEVKEAALQPLKEAGFEGVETTHICPEGEAPQGRAVAEKLGMKVHSVLRGWMEFNSEDPEKVEDVIGENAHGVARGQSLRRGCDSAGAVPHWRDADAGGVGV